MGLKKREEYIFCVKSSFILFRKTCLHVLGGTYINMTLNVCDKLKSYGSENPVEVTAKCPSLPCRILRNVSLRSQAARRKS